MLGRSFRICAIAFTIITAQATDKLTAPRLIELARQKPHDLAEALVASLGEEKLKKGTAFAGEGPDFIWAVESEARPEIYIDDRAGGPMSRAGKSNLWYHTGTLQPGTVHGFYYMVHGARTGGSTDVPAYGPDSYPKAGAPQGALSEKIIHTSKIYDGMQSDYWIYVPSQYDQNLIQRDGASRTLTVVDNLIAQKKIPVMIQVFIEPGAIGEKKMRSIEYDTVSDRYARFLRDEILADVGAKYSLRKDAYSRGIAGIS